jgi:hypothetical protein
MNKYIILLLVFISGFTTNDVRREIIVLDWHIASEPENLLGHTFSNAGYEYPGSQVPIFFKSFHVNNAGHDYQFVLENPVFDEIDTDTSALLLHEFQPEPVIKKTRLISNGNHIIEIQIPAVIFRENKLLLLKKFELIKIPVKLSTASVKQYEWKNESVLKEGRWVKIITPEKGIYKIPYSKLSGWGFSNPSQVNVFGAGGKILPEDPGKIEYDDLPQIAVWHGKNNGTDCLFFFAPGTTEWKPDATGNYFERHINHYATTGHFFLSEHGGFAKNIELLPEPEQAATHSITSFTDYILEEKEVFNLIHSGKQWFGDKFINGTSRTYNFQLDNVEDNSEISINIKGAGRSSLGSEMIVTANQTNIGKLEFARVNTSDNTGQYANERSSRFFMTGTSGNLALGLRYSGFSATPEAWLDFIEINYRRKLRLNNNVLFFRENSATGHGNIMEFSIEKNSPGLKVWDVTHVFNVREVPLKMEGNLARGKQSAATLREYAAFNPDGNFPEPEHAGEVENQNLHGLATPEFLIISHPNFLKQANNLADFHRTYDGMKVEVVSANKVYNEFSSGNRDATGIRNFIKMFYDRKEGLKYVLLFGDGSYDNKNIRPGSSGFIPTFQSDNSLNYVLSFVTDDYFVMLDPGESVYSGAIDLGIGRIPASTSFQADVAVKKVRDYHSQQALGNWRNIVCFIGDDGDANLHMSDSEKLANIVNENHSEFITEKIYFDAYQKISGSGGGRYPDVTDAINQRVKDGVLLLNYVGHANDRFLADEKVLDISHINSWSNADRLLIFVTATCEFSRFDADETSAGEFAFFNPNGGSIGLFSTTRLVFAYSNFLLSRSFYQHVFKKDENGQQYRMGDIMRLAKINTINTINKRSFSLLASPALKLSYPRNRVITSTINGNDTAMAPDTLGALKKVTITGFIADDFENKISNFNGKIVPTVYDKAVMKKTRGNAGATPFEFKVQENIIYRGLADVVNGEFSFSFVIPKDISYSLGNGKIIYYADNGEMDAHGAFENFLIGGPASSITDNQGPSIELFLDSREFVSGDKVSKNPTLLAFLSDENGINMVGSGIGHDITAVLNGDYSKVMILNNHYQANAGDYTSGTIRYPLKNLPVGMHTLTLKAWDVANNSTEVEIDFEVTGDFYISSIINYPNPVNDYTFFTFEHNQADATFEAIFEIFDQGGRRIDYFPASISSNGTVSNPVRWDLHEAQTELRSGIYVYRVIIQNSDGVITTKSGKLIVAR